MTPEYVRDAILPAAYQLLPDKMRKPEADALMLAIFLQESRLQYRIQLIGNHRRWWESLKGPARGIPQFERTGIRGVLQHPASRQHARDVLGALSYPPKVGTIHRGIAHNDVLAVCFSRLLLWTDPRAFPKFSHPAEAWWHYYLRNWRPGKPKRHTFDQFWTQALEVIEVTA